MNLSEMTPVELWERLEKYMDDHFGSWEDSRSQRVRAELKRRCDKLTEAGTHLKTVDAWLDLIIGRSHRFAASPCPVVGLPLNACCPKCKTFFHDCRLWPDEKATGIICPKCIASRPDAPFGYRFTGEWDKPQDGQYYLTFFTHQAILKESHFVPDSKLDSGRRWILEKVEVKVEPDGCWNCRWRYEPKLTIPPCSHRYDEKVTSCSEWIPKKVEGDCDCPTVRGEKVHWFGCSVLADLTRRVEKLEQQETP